jgi:hypothetical protein
VACPVLVPPRGASPELDDEPASVDEVAAT